MQRYLVGYPLERIAVDVPRSRSENVYVLVVGDYFTKWLDAYPIKNQKVHTVAKVIVDRFISIMYTKSLAPPEHEV